MFISIDLFSHIKHSKFKYKLKDTAFEKIIQINHTDIYDNKKYFENIMQIIIDNCSGNPAKNIFIFYTKYFLHFYDDLNDVILNKFNFLQEDINKYRMLE